MPITPDLFPCMPTQCPAPGLYERVAESEYRRWAAWSQSTLKLLGTWSNEGQLLVPAPDKSPAHAFAAMMDPDEPTEAQEFGTEYHRLLMEPARFSEQYVALREKIDRRTNAGKADWAALVNTYGEDCILSQERWDCLQRMAAAAARHPYAKMMLGAKGEHELSGVFVEPESKETVRFRLDKLVVAKGRHRIIDLKTTRCAHITKFQWDAEQYGYDVQAAVYFDGYSAAAKIDPSLIDYYLIVQEKTAPYAVVVYKLPEAWLDAGRIKYRAALKVGAECLRTATWPGYADDRVVDLHLPERAMAELEPIS